MIPVGFGLALPTAAKAGCPSNSFLKEGPSPPHSWIIRPGNWLSKLEMKSRSKKSATVGLESKTAVEKLGGFPNLTSTSSSFSLTLSC